MNFKLESQIPQLTAELQRRASELVRRTAFGIEGSIKNSMAEPKSGRSYKKGKAPGIGKRGKRLKDMRKTHTASAPGEAPAIDTGLLAGSPVVEPDSIKAEMTGDLSAVVGTNAEYSEALEFGTHKMAPRPFMGPAFEAAEPDFETGLKELLKI